jgi:serine/threonine-protein kinase
MIELTAERLAKRAFDVELLDEQQLRAIWTELGTTSITLKEFQQFLLRRGLLTSYQIDLLLRGEYTGFFFGEYRVLYPIGSGAFAKAYRAEHSETGEAVAIKALRPQYAADPEVAGQFVREGAVGVMLRHPNIVPIYEVSSKGDIPYLVMEFLEGQSLRQFLKVRQKLAPDAAVKLMCDVAAGLSYASERGISHRDLRTANVMVTSRGQAKLLDFGLAAVAHHAELDLVDEGPNARTIDYVGLERVTGVRKNDPRSDIYFAGAILYEMLAGRPPMPETTDRVQRLSTVRFTEVVPLGVVDPELPECLTKIADRAMQLAVDRRYQRPLEMLVDLQAAADHLAGRNGTASPHRTTSTIRNRPASVAAGEANSLAATATRQAPRDALAEVDRRMVRGNDSKTSRTEAPACTVMMVEPHPKMQEVFRQAFEDSGYRVLLVSDVERAIEKFEEHRFAADLLVIYASAIGRPAIDAFNGLAESPQTAEVPAVLLLGKHQGEWLAEARQAPHRLALAAPLHIRKLREAVARLLQRIGSASSANNL